MKQAVIAMMIAFLGSLTLTALATSDAPYSMEVGNNNTQVQLELDQWGNIIKPRLSFVNNDEPAGYSYRINIARDIEGASIVGSSLLSAPPWLADNILLNSDEQLFWGIETLNASSVSEGQSAYREFIVSLTGEVSDDAITFLTEHQQVSESQQSIDIKWKNNVPYSGATLSLYAYDELITEGINLNDYEGQYTWQIGDIKPGTYQVKGVVDDGTDLTDYNCCVITKLADERGISVVYTNGQNTNEDGTQTLSVAINLTAPLAEGKSYDITWKSNDISEALLTNEAGSAIASTSMSFNATNWSVAQTLYVTGVSDCDLDGNIAYTIIGESISTDTDYLWVQPRPIFLTNLEHSKVGQAPFICGFEVASSQVLNTSDTQHVVNPMLLNSNQYSLGVVGTLNGANEGVSVTGETNHSFGDVMPNTTVVSPNSLTVTLGNDLPVSTLALNWDVSLDGSTPPIHGTDEADALNGTEQTDVIYAGAGDDVINAGDGRDVVSAGSGSDIINAGAGDDFITIDGTDLLADILDGGEGTDILMGTEGDDTWRFSEIKNIENIQGNGGINIILGTELDDVLDFTNANLQNISYLDGLAGNDNIIGGSSDDELRGSAGNDTLNGGNGNDTLVGSTGNDDLDGGQGNDTLNGGAGDDVLKGNAGSDTYTFSSLDGLDTIIEFTNGANSEVLQFVDSNSFDDWKFNLKGKDLVIKNALYPDLQVITIENWVTLYNGQFSAEIADGTNQNLNVLFDISGLIYGNDNDNTLNGTSIEDLILGFAGDDILTGGSGDDVLNGATGNDTLDAGYGNDRILFAKGDGQDSLTNYDANSVATYTDTLVFDEGITLDGLTLVKSGNYLTIKLNDSDDQIKITNWFSSANYQLDQFELADGTVHSTSEFMGAFSVHSEPSDDNDSLTGYDGADVLEGGAGNDTLTAKAGDDSLSGGEGNDTLNGDDGNDQLVGGLDDDTLNGGNGDDVLMGGSGDDIIDGGYGNDRILFSRGDNQDSLTNYDANSVDTYTDTLVFGEGIALEDITLVKSGYYLLIKLSNSKDQIKITNWFSSVNYQLDQFELADGTVYTTSEFMNAFSVYSDSTDGNDNLTGYDGVDIMNGGAGNDTLNAKLGNDSLDGGEGDDTLIGENGNDQLVGGLGNDALTGGNDDDVLIGGPGNDTLDAGYGNDRILFSVGDGQDSLINYDANAVDYYTDTLVFGEDITLDNLTLVKSGYYLIIKVGSGDDQVTITNWFNRVEYQLDQFELADGTVYSNTEFMAALPVYSESTDGNDSLTGYDGIDIMSGGAGNDTLSSLLGNDLLDGGEGDDSLIGGDGNDQLVGGLGNDTLSGGDDDDVLIGGPDNDSLNGGYGNDRYVFNIDDGQDVISNYDAYSVDTYTDTLVFGEGITIDSLILVKSSNDLFIKLTGTTDQIKITNWFYRVNDQLDQFELADGTLYSTAEFMAALPVYSESTDGNDSLTGYDGIDIMSGGAGNDTLSSLLGNDSLDGGEGDDSLNGGDGNDQLVGGLGNDTLTGGNDDDVLIGGPGNDSLNGGYGNDRYLFNIDDGQDVISNYDAYSVDTYTDTLVFGEGITIDSLTLVKSSNDLIIKLTGTTDQIKITNWFYRVNDQLDQIKLADGTVYNTAEFMAALPVYSESTDGNDSLTGYDGIDIMSGGAGNDTLTAGYGDDTLDGGEGADTLNGGDDNDQLVGGNGDDILNGSTGDDVLTGGPGNDTLDAGYGSDRILFGRGDGQDALTSYDPYGETDTLVFGAGIALGDIKLVKSGNYLIIELINSEDQIKIALWFYDAKYQLDQFELADGTVYTASEFMNAFSVYSDPTDGNDTLTGYEGVDTMIGGAGNDTLTANGGNDSLGGGTGDDTLRANDGDDFLDGGEGNDILDGGNDNDQLFGGIGDDTLNGGSGDDVLTGGAGNDSLNGGTGNDRYLFGIGDGQDTLNTYDSSDLSLYTDTLVFGEGITLADLSLVKSADDLIIKLAGGDDQVTIYFWFKYERYQVDLVELADGTTYTPAELVIALPVLSELIGGDGNDSLTGYEGNDFMSGGVGDDTLRANDGDDFLDGGEGNDLLDGGNDNDQLLGGIGDDTLLGGAGDDVLTAGAGNDSLNGGTGNDRYLFGIGDGQDLLNTYDSSDLSLYTDTLVFGEGITLADLSLVKSGDDLIIKLAGGGDQVTIYFWFKYERYQVDLVELADGTTYTPAELVVALPVLSELIGGDGNDSLTGYEGIDFMSGGAGNDTLTAGYGDDTLDGGEGDDTLNGGYDNDQLVGGIGDDTLNGDVGNDVLTGGTGNDSLNGGEGNDEYHFGIGDGQDLLNTYDSSDLSLYTDTLVFGEGITLADISLVKSGDDLIIKLAGGNDQVTIYFWFKYERYQVDLVELADGTTYTPAELVVALPVLSELIGGDGNDSLTGYEGIDIMNGGLGNDTLNGVDGDDTLEGGEGDDTLNGGNDNDQLMGGIGDDTLNGNSGNDILTGGAGNDALNGGAGNDEYHFGTGDGQDTLFTHDSSDILAYTDTLIFGAGITLADISLVKSSDDLLIQLSGTQDQIKVSNWFYQVYYQVDLIKLADGTVYSGTEFANALPILSEVVGSDGNDLLNGYDGIDFMSGGAGNDTLNARDGDDTLDGGEGDDALDGGNGNDHLVGGLGNDKLEASDGDDVLIGGPGNDTLNGGYGNDRYLFNIDDGQDAITNSDPQGVDTYIDTLVFGDGITIDSLTLERSNDNLIIKLIGSSDQVTVTSWFYSVNYQLDQIELADGTIYTAAEFTNALPIE